MVKYKTLFGDEIKKVEIVRETDSSVWQLNHMGKSRRHSKKSSYEIYFDTWREAHDYLIEKAKTDIETAERRVEYARKELLKIEALQEN